MESSISKKPVICTIGGGKGGIGKSLMASNLGICLSRSGEKVLLIDADLGAANLHTFLGIEGSRYSLSNFLNEKVSDLQLIIGKTPFTNLYIISGERDALNVADLKGNKLEKFQEAVKNLYYDYIILDIGPGTSSNMLELFLLADEGILLVSPEPTSIENTYRFLKCLFLYQIKKQLNSQINSELKTALQKIFSKNAKQRVKTITDVFAKLKGLHYNQGQFYELIMGGIDISTIINQAKKPEDKDVGPLMQRACQDYFGFELGYLGYICYDDSVGDSIRCRQPLTVYYSQSEASKAIESISHCLLKKKKKVNVMQKFENTDQIHWPKVLAPPDV